MATPEEHYFRLEKWTGVGNFSLWACRLKDKIIAKGQDAAFDEELPGGMDKTKWDSLKRKVCSYIRLNLSDEIQMETLSFTEALQMWEYLEKRYLDKSSSSRMLAKAKLWSCVMREGDDLAAHVRTWTSVSCESIALGDRPMEDEDKAFLLLKSLPMSLDHLVQTIIYGKEKLTFDDVHNSLLMEAHRKGPMSQKGNLSTSALATEERGRPRFKGKKNVGPNSRFRSRSKSSGRKGELTCWECGKKGHVRKDCWQLKKGDSNKEAGTSSAQVVADIAEEHQSDDYIL